MQRLKNLRSMSEKPVVSLDNFKYETTGFDPVSEYYNHNSAGLKSTSPALILRCFRIEINAD